MRVPLLPLREREWARSGIGPRSMSGTTTRPTNPAHALAIAAEAAPRPMSMRTAGDFTTAGPSASAYGTKVQSQVRGETAKDLSRPTATYAVGYRADERSAMTTLDEIRDGLDRGEMFVEYLPIVALSDRVCVGAEALARWRRGDSVTTETELYRLVANTALAGRLTYWVVE